MRYKIWCRFAAILKFGICKGVGEAFASRSKRENLPKGLGEAVNRPLCKGTGNPSPTKRIDTEFSVKFQFQTRRVLYLISPPVPGKTAPGFRGVFVRQFYKTTSRRLRYIHGHLFIVCK